MTENKHSWVRQVTVTTLERFRHVLRTPMERDTKAAGTNKASQEHKRILSQIDALFGGTSIEVPPRFHTHPLYTRLPQGTLSTSTTPTAKHPTGFSTPVIESHPTETKLRWYKKMGSADAQNPPGRKSNPTGHLTLVQFRHPIDHATWFRNVLFWRPSLGARIIW